LTVARFESGAALFTIFVKGAVFSNGLQRVFQEESFENNVIHRQDSGARPRLAALFSEWLSL
jgi:hypothetical protein